MTDNKADRQIELAQSWIEFLHTNIINDPASLVVLPAKRRWTRRTVLLLCVMEDNGDNTAEIMPIAEIIGDHQRLHFKGYAKQGE